MRPLIPNSDWLWNQCFWLFSGPELNVGKSAIARGIQKLPNKGNGRPSDVCSNWHLADIDVDSEHVRFRG